VQSSDTSPLSTQGDKGHAGALANVLRQAEQPVPSELTKFGGHVKKKEHKLYGAFAKDVDLTKKATRIVFDNDD
jgi:ATP-dependent RNA helicase DBP3